MTILNVAYPLSILAPDAVGGVEQVISTLEWGLTAHGHRSLVLAASGSEVAGTLVEAPRIEGRLDVAAWWRAHEAYRALLRRILEETRVDVVHMHGVDFHAYLPAPGPPVLATLHLPASFYPPGALAPERPRTALSTVSETARRACPGAEAMAVVPNGVRLDRFHPSGDHEPFVLALGRICPEKGFDLALDAARDAGLPLILGGRVFSYPAHERHFEEAIRPRLDTERRFVGPLGLAERGDLLARARCVLISSRGDETSSLVAMEALASGTPVVAVRRGALAEIVDHGRTGLLVDDPAELAAALHDVTRLDRRECRACAEQRFDGADMVRGYEDVYDRIADRAPRWRVSRP